jgi:hypothetical protein
LTEFELLFVNFPEESAQFPASFGCQDVQPKSESEQLHRKCNLWTGLTSMKALNDCWTSEGSDAKEEVEERTKRVGEGRTEMAWNQRTKRGLGNKASLGERRKRVIRPVSPPLAGKRPPGESHWIGHLGSQSLTNH